MEVQHINAHTRPPVSLGDVRKYHLPWELETRTNAKGIGNNEWGEVWGNELNWVGEEESSRGLGMSRRCFSGLTCVSVQDGPRTASVREELTVRSLGAVGGAVVVTVSQSR